MAGSDALLPRFSYRSRRGVQRRRRLLLCDRRRPRLCKNARYFCKLIETSQKSQAWFKSARFRKLNFAELIYSEVGFCFYTASTLCGPTQLAASGQANKVLLDARPRAVRTDEDIEPPLLMFVTAGWLYVSSPRRNARHWF